MSYKEELKKANVTQKELSELLGVSKQTINDLLNGRNKNRKYIGMVNDHVGIKIISSD